MTDENGKKKRPPEVAAPAGGEDLLGFLLRPLAERRPAAPVGDASREPAAEPPPPARPERARRRTGSGKKKKRKSRRGPAAVRKKHAGGRASKAAPAEAPDSELGARLRSLFDGASDSEIAARLDLSLQTARQILRTGRLTNRAMHRVRRAAPDCDPRWLRTGERAEPADAEESARARLGPSVEVSRRKSPGRESLPHHVRHPRLPLRYYFNTRRLIEH